MAGKIKNEILISFDENLSEREEECEKYADLAKKALESLMSRVLINSRHMKTEINVTFTDNEGIRTINKRERNIDSPTDVLSFPLLDLFDGKGKIEEYDRDPVTGCVTLGDIVVSIDKIKEQAADYGHSEKRETAFLVCHGLLHLLGYDHIEPEREAVMLPLCENLLDGAGFGRDCE
jgi:probable rRNA maturation factor